MNRLLGQDVIIDIVENGKPVSSLSDVLSFSFEDKLAITEAGYLGQTTNTHGQAYSGTTGSFSVHMETAAAMSLRDNLIDRARRNVMYYTINISCSAQYADGTYYRVQFDDVQIERPKFTSSKRDDFVVFECSFACDKTTKLP